MSHQANLTQNLAMSLSPKEFLTRNVPNSPSLAPNRSGLQLALFRVFERQTFMCNQSLFKKQLALNHKGQGQVEYTMIVLLVTMVFWLGVRDTGVGISLQTAWNEVSGSILPVGGSAGKPGDGAGSGSSGSGSGSGGGSEGGSSSGTGSG